MNEIEENGARESRNALLMRLAKIADTLDADGLPEDADTLTQALNTLTASDDASNENPPKDSQAPGELGSGQDKTISRQDFIALLEDSGATVPGQE